MFEVVKMKLGIAIGPVLAVHGSVLQKSNRNELVVPLQHGGQIHWLNANFWGSDVAVHSANHCPAFLECPSLAHSDNLETLDGKPLGVLRAREFLPPKRAPNLHDVVGKIGLSPRSRAAENNQLRLTLVEGKKFANGQTL